MVTAITVTDTSSATATKTNVSRVITGSSPKPTHLSFRLTHPAPSPLGGASAEVLRARCWRSLPQRVALMDYPTFACHLRGPNLIVCQQRPGFSPGKDREPS